MREQACVRLLYCRPVRHALNAMKFKIPPNSMFAVLMRKPWWASAGIAVAIVAFAVLALPPVMWFAALCASVPFFIISGYSAWKRRHLPSTARMDASRAALAAMAWPEFARALEEGFVRDGATVKRLSGARADFEVTRAGRVAVVSARRWKAAQAGVPPLRELLAETAQRNADECIFVTIGDISDTAQAFAQAHAIKWMTLVQLAQLMPSIGAPVAASAATR